MGELNITITKKGYQCERCGHKWFPRTNTNPKKPVVCPGCNSPYWDIPKKVKK
jgi:DNA-directed RNA polymerase subunit RPC12/RpoP